MKVPNLFSNGILGSLSAGSATCTSSFNICCLILVYLLKERINCLFIFRSDVSFMKVTNPVGIA